MVSLVTTRGCYTQVGPLHTGGASVSMHSSSFCPWLLHKDLLLVRESATDSRSNTKANTHAVSVWGVHRQRLGAALMPIVALRSHSFYARAFVTLFRGI